MITHIPLFYYRYEALIYNCGTDYFQYLAHFMGTMPNSTWQDVLEEVRKAFSLDGIRQVPEYKSTSLEKIPLKDEGKRFAIFCLVTANK